MPRRRSPRVGNIIYANFGNKVQVSDPQPTAVQSTGPGNPAALVLIDAALKTPDSGRITRGRGYARNGNVVNLEFSPGRIVGQVAGSQNDPFNVDIVLPVRQPEQLTQVAELLLQGSGLRAVKAGRMSPELAQLMVCEPRENLRFLCDCPDLAPVCKHCVAVALKAADRLESDPMAVFQLRGMDAEMLEKSLRAQAATQAGEAAEQAGEQSRELFWSGTTLPDLPNPVEASALKDSDLDLLHKAMRSISYTAVDELRAVADIEEMYDQLVDYHYL